MTTRGRPLFAGAALATAVGLGVLTCGPAHAADPPSIVIDPDSGPAGTAVKVTGAHFCPAPCSSVTIRAANMIVATQVAVSASGTFSSIVEIPGNAPATEVRVVANQSDANGADSSAFTPFYVTPELPPATYYPPPTKDPVLPTQPASDPASPPPVTTGPRGPASPTRSAAPTSAAAGTSDAPSVPTASEGARTRDSSSTWPWVLGAVAAVAALSGGVFWLRRRGRPAA